MRPDKRFSVIMTAYDQASELEQNLPVYLGMDYEPGYEVIVVDETSTDNTEDALKLLKNDYPHLYTTFLPKPNRSVIRKKLAYSLGIKASKYEYVIFTSIKHASYPSDLLKAIADSLDDSMELTLGYITKKGVRLQGFRDTDEAQAHIRKAERRMRKIRERRWLGYTWGRYDFIIARKENAYDILSYYEQSVSRPSLLGLRLRILWRNLLSRPSTIMLYTNQ